MTKELRRLLYMNIVSSIIFIYIGIFVNLYIWEKNNAIFDVSWFNMILFISWGSAFALGAALLNKYSIRLLLSLSALCGGIAFAILTFVVIDNRMLWIALIGLPVGAMWGFYMSSQNLSVALYGKGKDFAPFFAAINTISQILSMIIPILTAQVIRFFGYSSTFIIMLIFLLVMFIFSRFMPKISLPTSDQQKGEFSGYLHWKKVFSKKGSGWLVLSFCAAGIFLQFQNLFTLIFTFTVTQNKTLIAILSSVYTLSSLCGLFMFKRIRFREQVWLWIGISLLSVGFLVVFFPYKAMLIVSNILTTVGMFYFGTVWNSQQYRFLQDLPSPHQAAFLVWRECLLCATRCIMLLIIISLKGLHGPLFIFIILLSLVCLVSIPIFQSKAQYQITIREMLKGVQA